MPTTVTSVEVRRNTNLDALRAIAVFMVLARHTGDTGYWVTAGWAGVDLFFVLSGFLVSGLLFIGYQERGQIDFSRFYIRRGLKIWPAFYTLIAVGLLVNATQGYSFSTNRLLPELFFMQSYFQGLWSITWSLAVEEHFYLTLPLILLLMLRRKSKTPFAAMPYVFGAIAVIALACRFAVGWKENWSTDYLAYLFPTHLRMDGLMFGVLLCYYHRFRPNVFERFASWRGGWMVVAVAAGLLLSVPVENRNMHTWGLTVIYLGAGFLVAKAVAFEGPRPVRVLSGLLARIGVYSYSIYLWHIFFRSDVLERLHVTWHPLWLACYFIGAILFGIAAATAIEFPVLRFRDRVFPRTSKISATSNNRPSAEEPAKEKPSAVLVH